MNGRCVWVSRIVRPALTAGLLGLCLPAWSAVPVEDAATVKERSQAYPRSADDGSGPAASADTGRLSDLFYQLEVLQREVQDLRGIVEEQGHRLDRLAKDQQEQYLDLDRRMQAVRAGNSSGSGSAGGFSSPSGSGSGPGTESPGGGGSSSTGPSVSGNPSGSERDAYTAAFQLMKQRQFDAAVNAFNQLVVDYPNGAYTPNAFYWLGEVYLAQDQYEKARQSFAQVVNLYPDHQKVPDALYKLGVVYHRLGDLERARQYLNRVIKEFPQSSAAGLAQTYLAEL